MNDAWIWTTLAYRGSLIDFSGSLVDKNMVQQPPKKILQFSPKKVESLWMGYVLAFLEAVDWI